ncbi:hypothetical protein QFZ77_005759 [Paenibacillus sp. V4I3]|nr:hypothetical protein [Paenibacillus sp. V4I3]
MKLRQPVSVIVLLEESIRIQVFLRFCTKVVVGGARVSYLGNV